MLERIAGRTGPRSRARLRGERAVQHAVAMAGPIRILAFSDLHRDAERAADLVRMAGSADLVLGAGDFGTKREGLGEVIAALRAIRAPSVLVPGNAESDAELRAACSDWPAARVLHGDRCRLLGLTIFGYGSATPPIGQAWSFDTTDSQARGALGACPVGLDVLVVHAPPQGCADRTASGEHVGSVPIREAIERCTPRAVVCGHVHDSWGAEAMLDRSRVINAGPGGMIFELDAGPDASAAPDG